MEKLSVGQRKSASEIFGNIAVAWFTAGVISPLFVKPESLAKVALLIMSGLFMTAVFTMFSLSLVKGVKS